MNLRPLALFTVLLLVATTAAAATPRHEKWERPSVEQRAEHMSERLALDSAQSQRLLEILEATEAEHEALRTAHAELIRQDLCAVKNSTHQQVREILTDQQMAEFDQMMERLDEFRSEWRERRHAGQRPALDCADEDGGED